MTLTVGLSVCFGSKLCCKKSRNEFFRGFLSLFAFSHYSTDIIKFVGSEGAYLLKESSLVCDFLSDFDSAVHSINSDSRLKRIT